MPGCTSGQRTPTSVDKTVLADLAIEQPAPRVRVMWLAIKPLNSQSSFLISLITPTMLLPIKHKINVLTNSDR